MPYCDWIDRPVAWQFYSESACLHPTILRQKRNLNERLVPRSRKNSLSVCMWVKAGEQSPWIVRPPPCPAKCGRTVRCADFMLRHAYLPSHVDFFRTRAHASGCHRAAAQAQHAKTRGAAELSATPCISQWMCRLAGSSYEFVMGPAWNHWGHRSAIIGPDGEYIVEPDFGRAREESMTLDVTGHDRRAELFDFRPLRTGGRPAGEGD